MNGTGSRRSSSGERRERQIAGPARWRDESLLVPDERRHELGALVACLLFVLSLSFVAGPVGTAAGLVTAGVWFLLGTPSALAAGTVLAVTLTPSPADPVTVALVGGPLLALVLAPVVTVPSALEYTAVVLLASGILGGGALIVVHTAPLWLGALVLLGGFGICVYGLHRYLLLSLGMLDSGSGVTTEQSTDSQSRSAESTDNQP